MAKKAAQDNAIYLVDASIYIFRAWFSLPDSITNDRGEPINAVQGFAGFIADFLRRTGARHVAFAFDASLTSSFRNEIDPAYKANRESAPPELKRQFEYCRGLVEALGMLGVANERYEADDYIATFAAAARQQQRTCAILSRDKDLAQLVNDTTELWDFAADQRWNAQTVQDKFGISPAGMIDYQALVGDSVDNIPGIKGIGPKAAAALIREYGSLEGLYANLDGIGQLPLRGAARISTLISEGREAAFRCRQLVTLVDDLPASVMPEDWASRGLDCLQIHAADPIEVKAYCESTGIGSNTCQRLLRAL